MLHPFQHGSQAFWYWSPCQDDLYKVLQSSKKAGALCVDKTSRVHRLKAVAAQRTLALIVTGHALEVQTCLWARAYCGIL